MIDQEFINNHFDFSNLFVFDLANNHQGSVEHALNIIHEIGRIANKRDVRGVFKFQFRQMDTFIHPAHHADSDNKHIPRFLATRLKNSDYELLLNAVREENMLAMCTPFDEESVDVITQMGFDLIKVASCSAKDWPLLDKVAQSGLPVIFSTGGLDISNIDDLVSFFGHKGVVYSIMHCVSIYPIPNDNFNLNQIDILRERYRGINIGWSTHENPDELTAIQIAVAKGATIFERHVGKKTDKIDLNLYSSTPEQVDNWIQAYKHAKMLCGSSERVLNQEEVDSIDTLKRGVFAKKDLKKGDTVSREDVFFAMPYEENQVESGHWKEGIVLNCDVEKHAPLLHAQVDIPHDPEYVILAQAVHRVKALLNESRISLNSEFAVEYSHHYGISKFEEFGAILIDCINREYCKKIIVQLPGQKHPSHFHKLKEETFQVLHGELIVNVDGRVRTLKPGDVHLVMPGVWHSFSTDTGCVFEEVSTTHYNSDSVYKDHSINAMKREERKTIVNHWGRFQLSAKSNVSA